MGLRSLSRFRRKSFGDGLSAVDDCRHVEVGLEPDSLRVCRHTCWLASLHGLHRARSRQAVARALAVPHALLPENMASFDFGSFARSVSGSGAGPVQVSIESVMSHR